MLSLEKNVLRLPKEIALNGMPDRDVGDRL
jgi:hypothetical protein